MINILFALIALSVMCIDIVINRDIIDEIDDEAEDHSKKLDKLFTEINLPKAEQYAKESKDLIEGLINRLKEDVKKSCASNKAQPFYWIIFFLSIFIVIYATIEIVNDNTNFISDSTYKRLVGLGILIWIPVLWYHISRLLKMLNFNRDIDKRRNEIKARVDRTMLYARMITGDPTFPLDIE